nr:conjugal transfer protein TraG N-terminal domain-containing protein [Aliarcobacter sp.]
MLKLIFTLFFISIPAFAIDSIYTWGYGEDIRNILISIKFFTANATYLIDTAIAIGLLLVMYKETQENNTDRIMKVAFLALIVSQLFFHSTKDYMVEDEVTNQAFVVTNVPVGIGELFSLFTSVERVLIKAFESSYSTPNSLNFSQVGLGFSMAAHL